MSVSLILGGSRSGKSQRAEALALEHAGPVTYIATAPRIAKDEDWDARIRTHQERRPADWTNHEVPLELTAALRDLDQADGLILVDCLTLWVSNQLHASEEGLPAATADLVEQLEKAQGRVVIVSDEVGSGVHPETSLGRRFRDAQGIANQRVAAVASHVELIVAGLVVPVKGP